MTAAEVRFRVILSFVKVYSRNYRTWLVSFWSTGQSRDFFCAVSARGFAAGRKYCVAMIVNCFTSRLLVKWSFVSENRHPVKVKFIWRVVLPWMFWSNRVVVALGAMLYCGLVPLSVILKLIGRPVSKTCPFLEVLTTKRPPDRQNGSLIHDHRFSFCLCDGVPYERA